MAVTYTPEPVRTACCPLGAISAGLFRRAVARRNQAAARHDLTASAHERAALVHAREWAEHYIGAHGTAGLAPLAGCVNCHQLEDVVPPQHASDALAHEKALHYALHRVMPTVIAGTPTPAAVGASGTASPTRGARPSRGAGPGAGAS